MSSVVLIENINLDYIKEKKKSIIYFWFFGVIFFSLYNMVQIIYIWAKQIRCTLQGSA